MLATSSTGLLPDEIIKASKKTSGGGTTASTARGGRGGRQTRGARGGGARGAGRTTLAVRGRKNVTTETRAGRGGARTRIGRGGAAIQSRLNVNRGRPTIGAKRNRLQAMAAALKLRSARRGQNVMKTGKAPATLIRRLVKVSGVSAETHIFFSVLFNNKRVSQLLAVQSIDRICRQPRAVCVHSPQWVPDKDARSSDNVELVVVFKIRFKNGTFAATASSCTQWTNASTIRLDGEKWWWCTDDAWRSRSKCKSRRLCIYAHR
jgi:hypothetical protein